MLPFAKEWEHALGPMMNRREPSVWITFAILAFIAALVAHDGSTVLSPGIKAFLIGLGVLRAIHTMVPSNAQSFQSEAAPPASVPYLQKLRGEGLSRSHFFFGVANTAFTPYLLGGFPQYFWIWTTIKSIFLIGYVFMLRIPKKQCFYMLDLCWWGAAGSCAFCLSSYLYDISPADQRTYFRLVFVICNGPLAWSVPMLHCSLVFHHIFHTANLFIHISPALLTLAMHWNHGLLEAAFPGKFSTSPDPELSFGEMWSMGMVLYFCWWVPYSIWLLVHGLGLPKRGYRTV
jgi:hypothetical protein